MRMLLIITPRDLQELYIIAMRMVPVTEARLPLM